MNTDAVAKIAMMKGSIRCLAFGLLGLLPFIGLPFALVALWTGGQVRRREKHYWNVARPFRIWGVVCAGIGAVIWATIGSVIVYNAYINGWPYND